MFLHTKMPYQRHLKYQVDISYRLLIIHLLMLPQILIDTDQCKLPRVLLCSLEEPLLARVS